MESLRLMKPFKILDYFAVKTTDGWLSPENVVDFEYTGSKAAYKFNVNGRIFTETVFVPKDKKMLVAIINSEDDTEYEIEAAINMRRRDENWHNRRYSLSNAGFRSDAGNVTIKFSLPNTSSKRFLTRWTFSSEICTKQLPLS